MYNKTPLNPNFPSDIYLFVVYSHLFPYDLNFRFFFCTSTDNCGQMSCMIFSIIPLHTCIVVRCLIYAMAFKYIFYWKPFYNNLTQLWEFNV